MAPAPLLLLAVLLCHDVRALELPSVHVRRHTDVEAASESLEHAGKWWVRMGDRVYHKPPASSGLSGDVSNYYYAVGSYSAIPEDLLKHRVGGEGRHHLFQLPAGSRQPDLVLPQGSRRSSISLLQQVRSGDELDATFPKYALNSEYVSPLALEYQEKERTSASNITSEGVFELLREITSLPTEEHPTRSSDNTDATEAAQRYLLAKLQGMGLSTCRQKFTHRSGIFKRKRMHNVVAVIPGSSEDSITVGAHYDSRPYRRKAPGADDNGSGLAALLAIARALTSSGLRPQKTVYFVAFAAEEKGLLGSYAWVDFLKSSRSLPGECGAPPPSKGFLHARANHAAIILDEVGWASHRLSEHTVNLEAYDWAGDVLEHLAQSSRDLNGEHGLRVVHSNNPFGSDHMPFLESNLHAVLLINGDDEGYPNYHKSSDTLDKVSPDLVAKIARVAFGGLCRLAGSRGLSA